MTKKQMIDKIYETTCKEKVWYTTDNGNMICMGCCYIGDVLDYMINDLDLWADRFKLLGKGNKNCDPIWNKLKESIEHQSPACVKYVYDLITNN